MQNTEIKNLPLPDVTEFGPGTRKSQILQGERIQIKLAKA
jgi:hypothetical protein